MRMLVTCAGSASLPIHLVWPRQWENKSDNVAVHFWWGHIHVKNSVQYCLFQHCIAYLVMIWEGYDWGTDSEDHGRVNLTMCICRTIWDVFVLEVVWGHGQHDRFFLQWVNVLYNTTCHKVLPTAAESSVYTKITLLTISVTVFLKLEFICLKATEK